MPTGEDRATIKDSHPPPTPGSRATKPYALTTIVAGCPIKAHGIFLVLPLLAAVSLPIRQNDPVDLLVFEASAPSTVWLSDITYISTREGWLSLAGHKDMYTREIVGYAMSDRMTKNLVSQSLFRAVAGKRPPPPV